MRYQNYLRTKAEELKKQEDTGYLEYLIALEIDTYDPVEWYMQAQKMNLGHIANEIAVTTENGAIINRIFLMKIEEPNRAKAINSTLIAAHFLTREELLMWILRQGFTDPYIEHDLTLISTYSGTDRDSLFDLSRKPSSTRQVFNLPSDLV